jgi:hypothetical protein
VPRARAVDTREVYFKDTSKGAKAARAAWHKHFDIAREVFWANKCGKPGVSLVAKMYNMDSSQISKICAKPDIKGAVKIWYEEFKARATFEILEAAAKGETGNT